MANLTPGIVQDWLDRYVEAWRTCEGEMIGDLFTVEAEYRYHPADSPVVGREAIVASWQQEVDPPGSWEAEYEPWLVAGDQAIATGQSRYTDGRTYFNLFQLEFDDGRCRSFTEWFMTPREGA